MSLSHDVLAGCVLASVLCAQSRPSLEQLEAELIQERARAAAERKQLSDRLDALQQRLESPADQKTADDVAALRVELDATRRRLETLERARGGRERLIDISLNLLTAAGSSTATDAELAVLAPGGHDPNRRGFTLQNGELSLAGAVDPWFRLESHVVFQIDPDGETTVELEEAYLQTLALPGDLQVKAGQYFTEFGRHNAQHPHQWDFANAPLANARMLGGDGLRAPGARVSWLVPTDTFVEVISGVQHPRGATQTSFLADPVLGGDRVAADRHVQSLRDLLYSERVSTSFNLGEESVAALGGSAAFGPNDSGPRADTQVYGVDAVLKWKPLANDQGWPFVTATGGYLWRRYEAVAGVDSLGNPTTDAVYHDHGGYAQVVVGFLRPWTAGLRVDLVDGDGATTGDGTQDRHWRWSPALTWYPSEFARLRLQVALQKAQQIGDQTETSVWLQCEVNIGAHGAHKF